MSTAFKRHVRVSLLLFLVAAAINLPLQTLCIRSTRTQPKQSVLVINGPAAHAYAWPERKPDAHTPWPPPDSYNIGKEFGHARINAISTFGRDTGGNGFQMTTDEYGWPFACLSEANRWWSWDDPAFKTSERPEIPMHLVWRGTLLNPLILATGAWILIFAPFLIRRSINAWRWRRKGKCAQCGYPLVPSGTCPECGTRAVTLPSIP